MPARRVYKPSIVVKGFLFGAGCFLIVTRIVYSVTRRVSNDEPQHLHVIWGWATGLLQYRDVFDNHTPLFHLLFGPIFSIFGETEDIVLLMRLAIMPTYFATLWLTYVIGRHLYSPRIGWLALFLVGLFPRFFLTSVEFRADDLWMLCWVASVALAVTAKGRLSISFWCGVMVGASLSVSMKTLPLLTNGLCALSVVGWANRKASWLSVAALSRHLLAGAVGSLVLPAVIVLYFSVHAALPDLYYGVIEHNIQPNLGHWGRISDFWYLAPCVPIIALITVALHKTSPPDARRLYIPWLFLTASGSLFMFEALWPLVTPQDYLPILPSLMITAAYCLDAISSKAGAVVGNIDMRAGLLVTAWLPAVVVGGELARDIKLGLPLQVRSDKYSSLIRETLRYSDEGDYVADLKGEMIYRPRAFYYAMEDITKKKIADGVIEDSLARDVIAKHAYLAAPDTPRFPPLARRFLNENFLPGAGVRVAGKLIRPDAASGDADVSIVLPGTYVLVSSDGGVAAEVDGRRREGALALEAGEHLIHVKAPGMPRLALVWAKAYQRGYRPGFQ